jgi:DNA-directed RNA polymerase I, II, and III subunit RPABC5|tara:strand:- start:206 stop:478 length:273 start_codon:yes stop_codon:yes gene_type:complete
MIIPVRCFTCGKVLADKWNYYNAEVNKNKKDKDNNKFTMDDISISENEDKPTKYFTEDNKNDEILNKLGLNKMCCRRHMLSHVDLIEIIS